MVRWAEISSSDMRFVMGWEEGEIRSLQRKLCWDPSTFVPSAVVIFLALLMLDYWRSLLCSAQFG